MAQARTTLGQRGLCSFQYNPPNAALTTVDVSASAEGREVPKGGKDGATLPAATFTLGQAKLLLPATGASEDEDAHAAAGGTRGSGGEGRGGGGSETSSGKDGIRKRKVKGKGADNGGNDSAATPAPAGAGGTMRTTNEKTAG